MHTGFEEHIKPTSQQEEQHLFMEHEPTQHVIQLLPIDGMTASTYLNTKCRTAFVCFGSLLGQGSKTNQAITENENPSSRKE